MKCVLTALAAGVIAAAATCYLCCSFCCGPLNNDRWEVIGKITKPRSLIVVTFEGATGTVESTEIIVVEEEIPQVITPPDCTPNNCPGVLPGSHSA